MTTTLVEQPVGTKRKGVGKAAITQLVRCVLVVLASFPIVFMIVSSFKPDTQIFADLGSLRGFLPVGDLSLDNYRGAFDRAPAGRFLLNSRGTSATTATAGLPLRGVAE